MKPRRLLSVILAAALVAPAAAAHEFWIEPARYQVETGAPLTADLRNGEEFEGAALAYFETRTARFELRRGGDVTPVRPRMGDVPALDLAAPARPGLLVILHQTAPATIRYAQWDKFRRFAEHKDFPDIAARHAARGLPREGFTESYTRFAKALVGVGAGDGADAPTGMETEFVALANPYAGSLNGEMPVRLLYRGAGRADAQVEVFDRAPDGTVTITRLRTDAAGELRVPVVAGHSYLLDAVVLRPAPDGDAAVWETLWAALTFAVP